MTIQIGTRVHCILYGGKDGVIYDIHGEQSPNTCRSLGGGVGVMGGAADFDIVWEDGTESRRTPECLVRSSVQWTVYDKPPATAEEIATMRSAAVLESNRRADEAKAKADKFAADCKSLRADRRFSNLKQITPGQYVGAAFAAANLRKQLKEVFPGVKFSVRSDSFSGGDSIKVSWTDGPTSKEVDRIADRYSAGSFDGMEDIYNYAASAWTTVFGDAKYVHTQRSYSLEFLTTAVETVCKEFGWPLLEVRGEGHPYIPCDSDRQRQVYDYLEKRHHYEVRSVES